MALRDADRGSDVIVGMRPLLELPDEQHGGPRTRSRWRDILDLEETKDQIFLALPMILTNVLYFGITLVSVMFSGHIGRLELAGAALANSWAAVTGFDFMTGLSGALETLCGQGFGARQYKTLGLYLQSSCIISLLFSVVLSIFWLYTEPVLVFLHQDPNISRTASRYLKNLIPGLFAYGMLQNILRFVQTQSVVTPLVVISLIPAAMHIGVAYGLVFWLGLGLEGAALAASISLWVSVVLLGLYVMRSNRFELTWDGFSSESLCYLSQNLKLSLPSAAMVCLEYWAFEILVFLAGMMANSEITTSLIAICVNTETIAYMLTYGLSAAASTRVSNELGAGDPDSARNSMLVTMKLSAVLSLAMVLALLLGHRTWAGFFTDNPPIVQEFASMTPFLAVSIALDSIQGVLSGVARGCGWQHLAMCVNLAMFYCVGTPAAIFLAFKSNLGVKGLWMGLICGLFCQASSLLAITFCRNWSSKFHLKMDKNKEGTTPLM